MIDIFTGPLGKPGQRESILEPLSPTYPAFPKLVYFIYTSSGIKLLPLISLYNMLLVCRTIIKQRFHCYRCTYLV